MRKGLGSVPSDSRINLYTCHLNVKQLYLIKNPNSLQEGLVSIFNQGVCVLTKGDECCFLSLK